jgi:hypothetical protein
MRRAPQGRWQEAKSSLNCSPRFSVSYATVPWRGLAADESYSPVTVFVAGDCGVSVGAAGGGAVAAGALVRGRSPLDRCVGRGAAPLCGAGAGAAAWPPRNRSAGSRLTSRTVVEGGPTGGATAVPTVILSASALPVFSTGAVALGGTVKVCPGCNMPEKSVAPPLSLTWIQTASVADRTTGPCAIGAGA